MRIQRYEPYRPWILYPGFGEGERKLLFGRVQDGSLLIVLEWLFTPDKKSCRLACLAVEENPESGMWMSVILQRCPVGLFADEGTRRFPLRRIRMLPASFKKLPDYPFSEAPGSVG